MTGMTTQLIVGMEVHVELATRSKMFTAAPNVAHPDFYEAEPNTLLDPVVVGMPGVLPVANREAVRMSIQVGLALGCQIARFTKWDRKSYYYPDLPKNYQISQYDLPLCFDGAVDVPLSDERGGATHRVRIRRAHLEEDAGKLLHEAPGGTPIDYSIVDLNRAGTPLLEIVTEPDFHTAQQVVAFAQMLRQLCRHLGVSEGVMQRGHMRFEPNINVVITREGKTYKTPIVEIKNLNSFRSVQGAVEYEYQRQVDEWLKTGKVLSSGAKTTRGWDDVKGVTFLQREKEEAHDYRYFPDPDLVPLTVSDAWLQEIRGSMPEMPAAREKRYLDSGVGLKETRQIMDDVSLSRFFEDVLALGAPAPRAATMLLNYGAKRANERGKPLAQLGITPAQVKGILDLVAADKIGSSAADQLFGLCCDHPGADPEQLASQHQMLQVSDTGALAGFVDAVLADEKNARAIADLKAGKDKAIGALVGQIMKLSKGQANPKLVGDMIKAKVGQ
jgi:aspartyl-tRNA(Asn)/glutamyl-tRNA(Gln) amidotransferase subunit B